MVLCKAQPEPEPSGKRVVSTKIALALTGQVDTLSHALQTL